MSDEKRKIHKLDEKVIKRISAGEVIHFPSNVLKELLENSIDSGATKITIKVLNGGFSLIEVHDNGCGISQSDMVIACNRHTTSKITIFNDITNISTFGFRGEALFSISCVSHLTIKSKVTGSETAYSGNYKDGVLIGSLDMQPGNVGTTVTVTDMFYNNPLKLKVLPDYASQNKKILQICQYYAILYHSICISVHIDNKEKIITSGFSDSLPLFSLIYGIKYENSIFYSEINDPKFSARLYLGKPSTNQKQIKDNAVFINGRLVQCSHLKRSISQVYTSFLMKGERPFFFVVLQLPPNSVDVNIHPTKKNVIFSDENSIIEKISSHVLEELKREAKFKELTLEGEGSSLQQKTLSFESKSSEFNSFVTSKTVTKSSHDYQENNIGYKKSSETDEEHVMYISSLNEGKDSDYQYVKKEEETETSQSNTNSVTSSVCINECCDEKENISSRLSTQVSMPSEQDEVTVLEEKNYDENLCNIHDNDENKDIITSCILTEDDIEEKVKNNMKSFCPNVPLFDEREAERIETAENIMSQNPYMQSKSNFQEAIEFHSSQNVSNDVFESISREPEIECKIKRNYMLKQNLFKEISYKSDNMTRVDPNMRTLEQFLEASRYSGIKKKKVELNLQSVNQLLDQASKEMNKVVKTIFRNHVVVGLIDLKYVLFSSEENLYCGKLFDITKLLFYHIGLKNFGNFGVIQFEEPIDILKLQDTSIIFDVSDINSHSELLEEYFGIKIRGNLLYTMPILIPSYIPTFSFLPIFLKRLVTTIDWDNELDCIHGILNELSLLYAIDHKDGNNDRRHEIERSLKSVVLPELKCDSFFPNNNLFINRSIVKITSVRDMYRIFERN